MILRCICQTQPGYWLRALCRAFTPEEEAWARRVATERHDRSYYRDKDSVYRKEKQRDLEVHIMGARAELAWCIFSGVTWPATVDAHRRRIPPPDVPPDIEIRCRSVHYENIIIRDKDVQEKGDRRFVMAHELADGRIEFNGWLFGHEASRFRKTDMGKYGKPAWFLSADVIHRLPFYEMAPKRHRLVEVG